MSPLTLGGPVDPGVRISLGMMSSGLARETSSLEPIASSDARKSTMDSMMNLELVVSELLLVSYRGWAVKGVLWETCFWEQEIYRNSAVFFEPNSVVS